MMNRRRLLAAACAAVLAPSATALATTGTVSVSQTQVGVTPLYVGYNQGHYRTGGNTSAWVDYAGINAFRVWAAPGDYAPSSAATSGDSITSLSLFEQKKSAVSTGNPETNGVIPLSQYLANFPDTQSGRNAVNLDTLLQDLKDRNISPVMQISRALPKGDTGGNWSNNWEQWQHFYAMAYLCAKNYGVERYMTYNEPDQSSTSAQRTPAEWVAGMKLAADAVRAAIADVNRVYGTHYVAGISAPTRINGANSVSTWTPGPGFSDYGEGALETDRTDYAGRAVNYDIFKTNDCHRYNDSTAGNAFVSDIQTLNSKFAQYNASGQAMPITYSEYNRQNSSSFAGSTNSLDTPSVFTELATTNLRAMSANVKGLYAFKFNQTLWDHDSSSSTPDVPQKTGFYYLNGTGTDTTGATKGAGVQKLFAKAFKGERPRLATGGTSVSTYDVATSFDQGSGNYYMMGVNRHTTQTHGLTLDLSAWDVQPGTVLSIEEVSPGHLAEVTRMVTVPQSKIISLTQPSQSVWLVTAPSGAPGTQRVITASDDARVRNSDGASSDPYRQNNYGSLTRAYVGRTPGTVDGSARFDYASYLQFDTHNVAVNDVSRAILQITGRSTDNAGGDPGSILFHVYALTNDAWDESTITWDNAPNLDDLDAKVTGVAASAFPVGMLTFDNTQSEWGIDLTDFIRQHPEALEDGALSFALVREERFTDDADPSLSFVELWTKESGLATAPKLSLTMVPEPGAAGLLAGLGAMSLLRRATRR